MAALIGGPSRRLVAQPFKTPENAFAAYRGLFELQPEAALGQSAHITFDAPDLVDIGDDMIALRDYGVGDDFRVIRRDVADAAWPFALVGKHETAGQIAPGHLRAGRLFHHLRGCDHFFTCLLQPLRRCSSHQACPAGQE